MHRHPFLSGPITPVRASPRREAFTVCAPGDARLSALHRGGLLASGPARDESLTTLPSFSDHWACELLASARNGGGRVSGASRASVCMHRLAGRRIPPCLSNASRKHPRRTGRGEGRRAAEVSNALSSVSWAYREREMWRVPPTRGGVDRFRDQRYPRKIGWHVRAKRPQR